MGGFTTKEHALDHAYMVMQEAADRVYEAELSVIDAEQEFLAAEEKLDSLREVWYDAEAELHDAEMAHREAVETVEDIEATPEGEFNDDY